MIKNVSRMLSNIAHPTGTIDEAIYCIAKRIQKQNSRRFSSQHILFWYFGRFHCIKNFAGVIWKKGRQWIRRYYDRFWLLWSYENFVIFFVNILSVRGHSFMTLTKRGRRGSILRSVAGGFLGKGGWGSFLTLVHIFMYNKQIYFYSS